MESKVPKLRFKEFKDEWKKDKASNLFKNISDKNHNGELEILSVTQDKGVLPRNELNIDIKFDKDNVINYKKVNKGDFIISLRSFQGGFEISNTIGLVSPAYTVFNFKDNIYYNSIFFSYIFKSIVFIKRLSKLIYGIRDGRSISFSDFRTMSFKFPSLEEQEKIANFFSNLDEIIEKQDKKVENLESFKKGLVERIFTKKVKFKDEHGQEYPEWEKKSANNIFKIKTSGNINDVHISKKMTKIFKYPIYSNSINNNGLYGYSDVYKVDENTITVTGRGINIGVAKARYCKYYPIVQLLVLYPILNLNIKFFEENINFIKISIESSSIPQLTVSNFSKILLNLPCLEEQTKIANILSNLDKIIEKESRKLECFREFKKGLMQRMFV